MAVGDALHYVIIGNGIAGSHAAEVLRNGDPGCRITVISAGALLFYNRYDLPGVFRGKHHWTDFLVNPPEHYEHRKITLRRKTLVKEVNANQRTLLLAHREEMSYDRLLVATGGAGYLPESLLDYRDMMHAFNNFRVAMGVYRALPEKGRVIMLGGDTIGLDLARTLLDTGYRVALVTNQRTFWPHEVASQQRPEFVAALKQGGVEVVDGRQVARVEKAGRKGAERRVVFTDGTYVQGDVVIPFCGLAPNVDFMSSSGIDMERGILVDAGLKTTDPHIWAAGDVCQIWSEKQNEYRFYYGWKNVQWMGEIAARNMLGEQVEFHSSVDETLKRDARGRIYSPFWEFA